MFHQLRIHTDAGESRQGVDLVEDHAAVLCQEEVHTGQSLTAQRLVCTQRSFPNAVGFLVGDACRNVQLGSTVYIFIVVIIEFRSRLDLAHIGCDRCIIAEYSDLQFSAVDEFLDDNLFIVSKCDLDSILQRLQVICLVYANRRACVCRLDKQRKAQCLGNCHALFIQLVQITLVNARPLRSLDTIII